MDFTFYFVSSPLDCIGKSVFERAPTPSVRCDVILQNGIPSGSWSSSRGVQTDSRQALETFSPESGVADTKLASWSFELTPWGAQTRFEGAEGRKKETKNNPQAAVVLGIIQGLIKVDNR